MNGAVTWKSPNFLTLSGTEQVDVEAVNCGGFGEVDEADTTLFRVVATNGCRSPRVRIVWEGEEGVWEEGGEEKNLVALMCGPWVGARK